MSTSPLPLGLYALCDDTVCPELSVEEQAERLLAGGVRTVQVRIKRAPSSRALAHVRRIVQRCHEAGALCLINDRVDFALLSDADGVHLGEDDLPIAEARALLGPRKLIGATIRNAAGADDAAGQGASYVGLGPIFATHTKAVPVLPIGLEGLRVVARHSPLPVVAIAGIGPSNIEEVARAGAHAAAVVSALLCSSDIPETARQLSAAFERGKGYALTP